MTRKHQRVSTLSPMPPKHLAFATIAIAFFACLDDDAENKPDSSSVDNDSYSTPLEYDGKAYNTVKIGTQIWMAENLNDEVEGSKCYENNPTNCARYGRLYNWETAMKACPKGWHLPSSEEWDKLYRFGKTGPESPYISEVAGEHLKAAGGWKDRGSGTNHYGFSALPGGRGYSGGSFDYVGYKGYWWTANGYANGLAQRRSMGYSSHGAGWDNIGKSSLFSVRCVRNK